VSRIEGGRRSIRMTSSLGRRLKTWHHRCVRVHRSFAFVDVSGFTALTELEGDEHAVEVLTAFRALLRDICSRRGVRIAKWLGDGVMLVCVETPPLLATILELHYVVCNVSGPAQAVSIRSGVTSGYVILMEGDDYIGHCVNVASRLCDLADGGEALASPSVVDYLPRWGLTLSHRDVTLRGVEKPIAAASIGMPAQDPETRRDPICGLPLTEITAEETADDARGRVVLFCSPGCLDTWVHRPKISRVVLEGGAVSG
jgi:adenylate cyclase